MELTITVPESWADVKLGKYKSFMKAIKPYKGVEDETEVMYEKAMNFFCDIDSQTIAKLPIENYNGIMTELINMFTQSEQLPLAKRFTIGSTVFGFIPSLDDMSYGEYLDLTTYFKDMWPNMGTIMSILYRPITEDHGSTYKIKQYTGTDEDMETLFDKAMTMDIVFGAISFFLCLRNELATAMVTYSTKNLMTIAAKNSLIREALEKSGADMSQLQSLLTTISQSSTKSQS
jgi:hypothetical protein